MRRAIFLDRDGVINRAFVINGKPHPPASLAALEILPGVQEALERLQASGFLCIVITNQPDVARGTTTVAQVEAIHQYLAKSLPIDAFYTCYHDTADQCTCRKPQPGALYTAAAQHQVILSRSYMIGDRWRDIEAGNQAGCRTIFIDYGYDEPQPKKYHFSVSSLSEAIPLILGDLDEKII